MKAIFFICLYVYSIIFTCNFDDTKDVIWVEVPSGEHACIPPTYTSIEDEVSQLTRNNIKVFDQVIFTFPVCKACHCPTGINYQAQIEKSNLLRAERLNWQLVERLDP